MTTFCGDVDPANSDQLFADTCKIVLVLQLDASLARLKERCRQELLNVAKVEIISPEYKITLLENTSGLTRFCYWLEGRPMTKVKFSKHVGRNENSAS